MENIEYRRGAIDASDCVGQAWELVKRNIGLYIGAAFLVIILLSCIPFVNIFLLGPMMGGFNYIVLRDLRNEPVDFGMLFKGFEKFVPLMVLGLIQSVPGVVLQIFQYVGDAPTLLGSSGAGSGETSPLQTGLMTGFIVLMIAYFIFQIIWNAALTFAIPLVIEHNAPIGDAITLSLGAVFSNLGGMIVLAILSALVGLLGLLALCIGIFVALPVTLAAYVVAYRQVFPYFGPDDRYTGPPPPDTYSFGRGL